MNKRIRKVTEDEIKNGTFVVPNGVKKYIMELVETAKHNGFDPLVLIEQRVDFSSYVEGGFGTCDCVVIAGSTLNIIDFRMGAGALTAVDDNMQLKLYALGALKLFDGFYDIDTVSMTTYQPRRNSISTHTVFKESLYQWAAETLKPIAKNATDWKNMLKQLALEFIDGGRNANFEHWETAKYGGSVEVFGDVKTDRSKDYYISTSAEMPTKCKFYNEITVSATCIAVEDGEDVFDCRIEDLGLTKKQLAAFIKSVKFWSLRYK